MKLVELISNKGQSLLELVIAIGVFVIVVSGLSFFILDSYNSGRLSYEMTKANFLAEEGIDAVISIRNNNWDDLLPGNHGLLIQDNKWILSAGNEESLKDYLREGNRVIEVQDVEENKKKIISKVSWKFEENRVEEIELYTYLTNWQKTFEYLCMGECLVCENFENARNCNNQDGCRWRAGECTGSCTVCDSFSEEESCLEQRGCLWEVE